MLCVTVNEHELCFLPHFYGRQWIHIWGGDLREDEICAVMEDQTQQRFKGFLQCGLQLKASNQLGNSQEQCHRFESGQRTPVHI